MSLAARFLYLSAQYSYCCNEVVLNGLTECLHRLVAKNSTLLTLSVPFLFTVLLFLSFCVFLVDV